MKNETNAKKKLGLFMATALVAGNMIGSGILMLPASLAAVSGPGATIIAWLLTGIGSTLLALSFAKLGSKIPKTGGPYEYTRLAFGDFTGFLSAWLYWTGAWIGNAAIITVVASYSATLIPIINQNGTIAFLYTSGILWFFTIVNILGTRKAGVLQTFITVFKFVLFGAFAIIAALNFNVDYITPVFPQGRGLSTVPAAAILTLWAFVGFESSTVNGEEIENPERNIKLSTIFGMIIVLVAYMLISFVSMGAMSQTKLAASTSPIIDIIAQYIGTKVTKFLLIGAVISVLGTVLGWILTTARMSYAAARGGVFPKVFGKLHPKYNTPYASLIINAVLTNILLFMNYTSSLSAAFNFMMLLATLSYLPVYAFGAAADIILLSKKHKNLSVGKFIKNSIVPLLAFIYAVWAIYGAGAETVLYGFLLILFGVPFYVYMRVKNNSEKNLDIEEI